MIWSMWDEVLLLLVPFQSPIFDVFLDLVIFANFNATSIYFYAVKCLIYIYFV